MRSMRRPKLVEQPVPVVSAHDLQELLKACSGRSFDDRRETAVVSVFIDTGARLAEVAGIRRERRVLKGGEAEARLPGFANGSWSKGSPVPRLKSFPSFESRWSLEASAL
jgi:site-specific recombinase XerC